MSRFMRPMVSRDAEESYAENMYSFIKHSVKPLHHELAEKLSKGYEEGIDALLHYYFSVWGDVAKKSPFVYPVVDFKTAVSKPTLLAYLILERMIIMDLGMYKNITLAFFGQSGAGKTTYSILSGIQALVMSGYSFDSAIDVAGHLTLFDAEATIDFFDKLIGERQWVPFIIIDDVGAQISKYWIFLKKLYWAHYFSVLDHVKDWCGALVMTAKHEKRAPAGLRDMIDIVVRSYEADVRYRDGNIYTVSVFEYWNVEPRVLEFVDVMPPGVLMPEKIWGRMLDIRTRMGSERIKAIKERLAEEKSARAGAGEAGGVESSAEA